MKVLFVYRGYGQDLSNAVVDNQINAVAKHPDIEVFRCAIARGGKHYLKYPRRIRKLVRKHNIDVIHAHYSVSAFVASMAFSTAPVVCSLMGSDLFDKTKTRKLIPVFFKHFWKKTIVKSTEMQERLPGTILIPNGVDMENFRPMEKETARKKLGLSPDEKYVLFVGKVASMPVKNLPLAKAAINYLQKYIMPDVRLKILENISFTELPYYYNAGETLLLTSITEGSPNVVKEALACNCKVVSTDVGDVKKMIGDIEGCYIASFDEKDVAEKIKAAIDYNKPLKAREEITYLDNKVIVEKIVKVYEDAVGI